MRKGSKIAGVISTLLLVIVAVTVLSYHAVDNSISEEDKRYIPLYLDEVGPLPDNPSYKDELRFIISVQRSVLSIAPGNRALPFGQKREAKELYEAKSGLCYDRSRVIEKLLRFSGFQTRHISMYSKKETGSSIESLLTPGISSHAVTEVLTKNGWLVVDSNSAWVSTNVNSQPVPIEYIQQVAESSTLIKWDQAPPSSIYIEGFAFLYGLYSRHGYFYPPYNRLPDINYAEFIQNLL